MIDGYYAGTGDRLENTQIFAYLLEIGLVSLLGSKSRLVEMNSEPVPNNTGLFQAVKHWITRKLLKVIFRYSKIEKDFSGKLKQFESN